MKMKAATASTEQGEVEDSISGSGDRSEDVGRVSWRWPSHAHRSDHHRASSPVEAGPGGYVGALHGPCPVASGRLSARRVDDCRIRVKRKHRALAPSPGVAVVRSGISLALASLRLRRWRASALPVFGCPMGWERIGPEEGTRRGGLATARFYCVFLNAPDQPRWNTAILSTRAPASLARSSPGGRSLAHISDSRLPPCGVSGGRRRSLLTWLGRQGGGGVQLALIDVEAMAITTLLTTAMQRSTGRPRPFVRTCGSSSPEADCSASRTRGTRVLQRSHFSIAFTAASTLCVQQLRASRCTEAPTRRCGRGSRRRRDDQLLRVSRSSLGERRDRGRPRRIGVRCSLSSYTPTGWHGPGGIGVAGADGRS